MLGLCLFLLRSLNIVCLKYIEKKNYNENDNTNSIE